MNFFWQGSRDYPARRRDEFDELWVTEHFITLLTAVFFGISGAIEAVAAVHGLANHIERQDTLSRLLTTLVEAMNNDDPDDEHDARTDET